MNHIKGLNNLERLKVYKSWMRLDKLRQPRFIGCDHTYIDGVCVKCLNTNNGDSLAYLREKENNSYADI
jgi:hypothetical protein